MEDVGLVGALLGILTTTFAGLKTIANTISDHTLGRKKRKASEDVNTTLELLRKFKADKRDIQELSVYEEELQDNLKESLATLQAAREKMVVLAEKRLEPKKGWVKWFVLYRPLSLDGILAQACFFGLMALILVTTFRWLHNHSSVDDVVGFGFGMMLLAFYLSGTAYRIRLLCVVERKTESFIDDGLTLLRRNLLWFYSRDLDAWLDRLFYYASVLCFFLIALAFALNPAHLNCQDLIEGGAILLLLAVIIRVSRADALAIRSLHLWGKALPEDNAVQENRGPKRIYP